MLASTGSMDGFCNSPLYEHMTFKKTGHEFSEEMKNNLRKCFRDEEAYGFLKADKRWQELVK